MQTDTSKLPLPGDPHPVLFDHAVHLAAAFVANGSIRLSESKSENVIARDKLARLIADMYDVLSAANEQRLNNAHR